MAKNNEAKVKFTADTEQFNESLKQVSYNTKELKSEMKLIEAQMKHGGATIDNLQSKHDNLSAQLKENENLQEALNNKLEVAVKYFDENSTEAQNLRIQLNNARIAHEKLEAAVNASSQQLDEFRAATTDTRTAGEKLTDTINEQQSELDRLKKEYKDVILEQDEGSEAAKELERKISELNGELEENKRKLKDADDATDKLTGSLEDSSGAADGAGDGFTTFKGIVADLASNAIQWAIGAISDFVSSLWGLAEETREFRQDMGTLETAFDNVGFSTEQATDTWKELYSVFGEDDRAVEAANNIARMAKSEEELNQWTNILTGAWGVYQDALPVESLAESAGETAKVGTVTGALADALNWSSEAAVMFADYMSEDVVTAEDAFNVALSKCTTEQERQALITDTLTALYGNAAGKYEETSGAIMDYNESNANLLLTQAELAETIQPLNTLWNETKAQLLDAVTPAVKEVTDAIIDVTKWLKENEPVAYAIAAAIGVIGVALAGYAIYAGVAAAAQMVLNAAMLPVIGTVLLVAAAIAAVIAIIILVVSYWDEIVASFKYGWELIKEAAVNAGNWFKETWQSILDWFSQAWNNIVTWWNGLWQGVSDWFNGIIENIKTALSSFWQSIISSPIVQWFTELFNSIYATFSSAVQIYIELVKGCWEIIKAVWGIVSSWFSSNVIEPVKNFFVGLWNTVSGAAKNTWESIKGAFSAASSWFNSTVVAPVKEAFSNAWSTLKSGAQNAWSGIKSVFSSVASYFGNIFSNAWNKVKAVFSTGGKIFSGIVDGITAAFKKIVNAIIRGINRVVAVPFNAINSALSTIRNVSIAGISPFSGLPSISVPQIPLLAKGGIVDRATLNIAGEAGPEAIAPIDKLQGYIEEAVNASYANYSIASLVAAVEDLAERAIQLNINGREFATATAGDTDSVNGRRVGLRTRGLATT